jgi:phospholipase C
VPPGQLEPFPEEAQPPLEPGRLAGIDHIVVLMMENRSFDHMLGYLSLAPDQGGRGRTDIDGLKSGALPSNRYLGQGYPAFRVTDPAFVHRTPPHGPEPVLAQIAGGQMSGFVSAYAKEHDVDGEEARAVMSYYDASTLDVYDQLAAEFLICDRWFAAHPGPTFCNRFYTLTGRLNRDLDGNPQQDNFHGADFVPVQTKNVFDHLSDRGVSWRYYEQRYSTIRLYAKYTFDHDHVVDFDDPVDGFAAAATAGTLPSVTFIDPNFIDEPDDGDNDDAAPGNLSRGQVLVGGIVNALRHSPAWDRTMFVLTYDEHGGFFDHVNPLATEFRATATPVSALDFYGVRVPTFVISPLVARGAASHIVFDHTSILKTIIRRFMSAPPPDMGSRVAAANDLSAVLLDAPRATNFEMPEARRVDNHQPPSTEPAPGTSTEFKDVMRFLRDQAQKTQDL